MEKLWILNKFTCNVQPVIWYDSLLAFTISKEKHLRPNGKYFRDLRLFESEQLLTLFFEICRLCKEDEENGKQTRVLMESISGRDDDSEEIIAYTFWLLTCGIVMQSVLDKILAYNCRMQKSFPMGGTSGGRVIAKKAKDEFRLRGLGFRYLRNNMDLKSKLQAHSNTVFSSNSTQNTPNTISSLQFGINALFSVTITGISRMGNRVNALQTVNVIRDHLSEAEAKEFRIWRPGYFYEIMDTDASPENIIQKYLPDIQLLIYPPTLHTCLDVQRLLTNRVVDPLDEIIDGENGETSRGVLQSLADGCGVGDALKMVDAQTVGQDGLMEIPLFESLAEISKKRLIEISKILNCVRDDSNDWRRILSRIEVSTFPRIAKLAYLEHQNIVANSLFANFRDVETSISKYHQAIMDFSFRKKPFILKKILVDSAVKMIKIDNDNGMTISDFVENEIWRWNTFREDLFASPTHLENINLILLVTLGAHNHEQLTEKEVGNCFIFHSAQNSTGKSWLVELANKLNISGSVKEGGHVTVRAMNSDKLEQGGSVVVYNDQGGIVFGVGKGKEAKERSATMLQLLTAGNVTTMTLVIASDGSRTTVELQVNRFLSILASLNDPNIRKDLTGQMRSRMEIIPVGESQLYIQFSDYSMNKYQMEKEVACGKLEIREERIKEITSWEQSGTMELYRLIRGKAFEMVNKFVPRVLWNILLDNLIKKTAAVKKTINLRNGARFNILCVVTCLRDVFDRFYLREGGKYSESKFDPRTLADGDIDRRLFVTVEHAIYALSTVPNLLFNQISRDVRIALRLHFCRGAVSQGEFVKNQDDYSWIKFTITPVSAKGGDRMFMFSDELKSLFERIPNSELEPSADAISESLSELELIEVNVKSWRLPIMTKTKEISGRNRNEYIFNTVRECGELSEKKIKLFQVESTKHNNINIFIHLSLIHHSKDLSPSREILIQSLREVLGKSCQGGISAFFGRDRRLDDEMKEDFMFGEGMKKKRAFEEYGRLRIENFPLQADSGENYLQYDGKELKTNLDIMAALQRAEIIYETPYSVPKWEKTYSDDEIKSGNKSMFLGKIIEDDEDIIERLEKLFSFENETELTFPKESVLTTENRFIWDDLPKQFTTDNLDIFMANFRRGLDEGFSKMQILFYIGEIKQNNAKINKEKAKKWIIDMNLGIYKLISAVPYFQNLLKHLREKYKNKRKRET